MLWRWEKPPESPLAEGGASLLSTQVYSTLYLDLVEGLRMQRKGNRSRSVANDARSTAQADSQIDR